MALLVVIFKTDLYPYVRTTQRQKFVDRAYQMYRASQDQIAAAVVDAMSRQGIGKFGREPLRLALLVNVPGNMHQRDLSNVLKGVEDGAQGHAYDNDGWIDQVYTRRYLADDRAPRALLALQPISDGPGSFRDWIKEVEILAMDWGIL